MKRLKGVPVIIQYKKLILDEIVISCLGGKSLGGGEGVYQQKVYVLQR